MHQDQTYHLKMGVTRQMAKKKYFYLGEILKVQILN